MPWLYVVIRLCLVVAAGVGVWLICRGKPRRARAVVGGTVLLLLPLQLLLVKFPWPLANATGWADVIFFAEIYPELAALAGTAALLAQETRGARVRTGVLTAALAGVALVALSPLQAAAESFPPARVDPSGVVRQTRPSSCGAAAAATLLRAEGLAPQASEAELAALCLTDAQAGTRDLGLFRGLSLSAPGRPVRFSQPGLEGLRARSGAAVIFVGLSADRADPALYQVLRDECGWAVGVVHAVVCYGFEPGRPGEDVEVALIGDPRYGYERWGVTHFKALWTGQVLGFE
jgi:hypothetical protein